MGRKITPPIQAIFLLFFIMACSKNRADQKGQQIHQQKLLHPINSILFELDSITMSYSPSIQYFEDNNSNKRYFTTLNILTNDIYWYDYSSKEIEFITKLDKVGPNGVGEIQSYFIHNKDSIFVLGSQNYLLSIVNKEGKIISSYKLSGADSPRANTQTPIIKAGDKVLITNYFSILSRFPIEKDTEKLEIVVNIVSGEISFRRSFPEYYLGKVWSDNFLQFHHLQNTITGDIIYDFPADQSLYVNNIETGINKEFSASPDGFDLIEPYSTQKTKTLEMSEKLKDFFLKNSYYATYFDKYRNMYVRVALKEIENDDFNKSDMREKEVILVALDSNFKKIGDYKLPNSFYSTAMVFFTKEGMNVVKFDKENEDVLEIGIFEISQP